jgi:hypothetical protein
MSRFYGRLEGKAKNPATMCGSIESGLHVAAGSWDGGVEVNFSTGDDGRDMMAVYLVDWPDMKTRKPLYVGPCSG